MYKGITKFLEKFIKRSTLFKYGFNLSPVYRRSTGRILYVSDDLRSIKIKIPLNYKNSNYLGTMFGGSMASATDPIYMIQLITLLGNGYVVWDKSVLIRFKRPGNKTLYAEFVITDKFFEQIKNEINQYKEKDFILNVNLIDKEGNVYAEIEKVIYIASKDYYKTKKKSISIIEN